MSVCPVQIYNSKEDVKKMLIPAESSEAATVKMSPCGTCSTADEVVVISLRRVSCILLQLYFLASV